jgi:hypothetical protein
VQLQTSSQSLEDGVEVAAVAAKQLKETRLEVMRDRKLSIDVAEAVRDRLAVDTSAAETCQVFAEALGTALNKWNTTVDQLDGLREHFIQAAINGRAEDKISIDELTSQTGDLIKSIQVSLSTDLGNAIATQREALVQLGDPMNRAQQLTADLIQELETLKARMDQQSTVSSQRPFWGQGGAS